MDEDKDMHPHRRSLGGAEVDEGRGGSAGTSRTDDRNEEIDESPVPDPEAKETDAGDDPEAD